MGMIKRVLGYASLGVAKESARRSWESRDYVDSAFSAAEAGLMIEAAKNLLGPEFKESLLDKPQKNTHIK